MVDYSPKYTSCAFIRGFTSPPLDYSDVPELELLSKIQMVEDYVDTVYETGANIPCALLVLSKLVQSPTLAQKYYTLRSETLGDYSYSLGGPRESSYSLSETYEQMAHKMLRMLSAKHNDKMRVYITNN